MAGTTFRETVTSALDPVLVPYGFAPGQGGENRGSGSTASFAILSGSDIPPGIVQGRWAPAPVTDDPDGVGGLTFCAPSRALTQGARVMAGGGDPVDDCVDITVRGWTGLGITSADLCGLDLAGVLARAGLADHAHACAALPTGDLAADAAVLRAALVDLFQLAAD